MSEAKKIWVVMVDVRTSDLEDKLNALADAEYTVHSVSTQKGDLWTVLAYDPAQVMKKTQAAMAKQLLDQGIDLLGKNLPTAPPATTG